jgi:hypothetical protein
VIEDLLMHLQNNKILLVIDNLETVIDNNICNLVRQLPQGSKILFTTRIGLIFKKQLLPAEMEIERARDLSPNYFEVYHGERKQFLHDLVAETHDWRGPK